VRNRKRQDPDRRQENDSTLRCLPHFRFLLHEHQLAHGGAASVAAFQQMPS